MSCGLIKIKLDAVRTSLLNERASRMLFFAGFTLWLVWKFNCITVMSLPEGSIVYTLIHLLVWVLLALPAVAGFVEGDKRIEIAIAILVGVAVKFCADDVSLVDLAILFAASENIDFKVIAKHSALVVGFMLSATVVLSLLGVIVDYPFTRGTEIRHGLGFSYCTYPSLLYMYLVLVYLYLKGKDLHWYSYTVIIIIDIALFLATDSRSPFALVLLACVISLINAKVSDDFLPLRVLAYLVRFMPVVILAASIALAVCYRPDSGLWQQINRITSGRVSQTQASLAKYGVKPFGQYIKFKGHALYSGNSGTEDLVIEEGSDTNFIDSSLMQALVTKGFVTTIAVLCALFSCCSSLYKQKEYLGCSILVVVFISIAFDPQLLNLLYNTFLFYIWKNASINVNVRNPVSTYVKRNW